MNARLGLLLGLAFAAPVLAQDAAPVTTPTAAIESPAPQVSIEDAYKKEFAFLEAQKRELQRRISQIRGEFEKDRARLESEVAALEAAVLAAQSRAEQAQDALARAEQQGQASVDNQDLVTATLEQARSTLGGLGVEGLNDDAFVARPEAERLQAMFAQADRQLAALQSVRREPGSFYLADGSEVQGTLVHYGNVATFGVSDAGSGALAPAGGGRFKLWNAPTAESAAALANKQLPSAINAFVYDNASIAVSEPEAKTVWGEVQKGGVIGYVILLLGAVAMLLVVLRALFLQNAGASIGNILDAVTPAVKARKPDEAISAAKRFKGSAARVVTAALRNVDREREHLEDIVSESILHESTRLNRFGSVITMIAAVAPLLGLLGTVTGMIQTFDVITEFGTSDPKLLSGGIATALVTTELGLIVAIPCLLLGNLLGGWADRIKDDMEKAALRTINLYKDVRGLAA
ncbi:MotA/TolQ/ExbB proton channel family protein [Pseudomarimonas salicorniae]|uniref:MotA/TolQ/ExbB proton channel family protein n=1 Tax=Pseudomarimonas salicorniae TaxID=2933270 RepID=A0ABT0GES5_9GAMM|nr:MotA/TolQ/ExbB proton channel family protein [Lysobacter sp. CAU 1642]MCK7592527.1 MotA/TolQ/ExbB proton channel family protein [Lysobacter sp. CAU 1642]